jgi:hypothetical protein
LKKKFFSVLRWNIIGSIFYESLKFAHQIALLSVLGFTEYGIIGTTFSILYLAVHLADFESRPTLLPFLQIITKNKQRLKTFFSYYIAGNTILLAIGALIASSFFSRLLCPSTTMLLSLFFLIIFEGLSIFLRFFLHTVFINKPTVIIDSSIIIAYYCAIWIPFLFLGYPLTLELIFVPYLINSILTVTLFGVLLYRYHSSLPSTPTSHLPSNLFKRMLKIRIFSYGIHVSRYLFTGNFLAPFLALTSGIEYAGLLKFASYLADGVHAILKTSIGISGSTLLARLKDRSFTIKRRVFTALFKTLTMLLYPILIFLLVNYRSLVFLWAQHKNLNIAAIATTSAYLLTQPALLLSLMLLVVSLMDHFFLAYDEFFIIEERPAQLMFFKLFEFVLFYLFIFTSFITSLFIMILAVMLIRIFSFLILAMHSYYRWKITPYFGTKPRYVIISFLVSLLFLFSTWR